MPTTPTHPTLLTLLSFLSLLLPTPTPAQTPAPQPDPRTGELIVFTQPDDTPRHQHFLDTDLPQIRDVSAKAHVPVRVIDVTEEGAPPEIKTTPVLVYQNFQGRSIFQGRYASGPAVRNFLRTARAVPQGGEKEVKDSIYRRVDGRAQVMVRPKLTELAGVVPDDFDAREFAIQMDAGVSMGLSDYGYFRMGDVTVERSDRVFYYDFYPYRSDDGKLFVSLALFSPFNCIEPVFTRFDEPVSGPWEERAQVFAEAARVLEEAAREVMAGSELGDGFATIADSVATVSWADLGLTLPERPQGTSAVAADVELGTQWVLPPAQEGDAPRVQFHFAAPLDRYAGEASEVSGEFVLGETEDGPSLDGMDGWVEVRTGSVTMGLPALDAAVHGKMLKVETYPTARFELSSMTAEPAVLRFGTSSQAVAQGTFSLLKVDIPLDVRAQIEPVVGDDGQPRLWVRAQAQLRIGEAFGLEGPDGPSPARDTVVLVLDFEMVPAE